MYGKVKASRLFSRSISATLLITSSGLALMAASAAMAQTDTAGTAPAATTASGDGVETVVVTGTRIRGIAPVGSPLIQLDQSEIKNSGLTSTADILSNIPQVLTMGTGTYHVGGAIQENSTLNALAFNKSANLRGFGPQATLNLVDGHRMPFEGANMNTFDGDDIPEQMLERVEVVADGTSPIYGADAIAGTVNYIMRTPQNAIETYAGYGNADGQSNWQATQILGRAWDTGGIMVSYQRTHYDVMAASSRPSLYSDDYSPYGGPPSSNYANPGTVVVNGVTYAIPKGQDGSDLTLAELGSAGTANHQNVWKGADVIPESDRDSLAATAKQQIFSWLQIFADGVWTDRTFALNGPSSSFGTSLTVPNSNFYSPCNRSLAGAPAALIAACATGSLKVNYNVTDDLSGPGSSKFRGHGNFRTLTGSVGAHINLPFDWLLTLQFTNGEHSESGNSEDYRGPNLTALNAELAGTTASTAFNVFCDGGAYTCNPSALTTPIIGAGFPTTTKFTLKDYTANADGPLFGLPGGEVHLALGAEYARTVFTNTNPFGVSEENRNVTSEYAELYVPIFGQAFTLPLVRSLELDIAGRIDNYSDVGQTKNSKFGLNWSPVDDLKLHASIGTSFRAPGLADNDPTSQHIWLFAGPYPGSAVSSSICPACAAQPALAYLQDVGGAPGTATPEDSRSYSVGGDWTPASIEGLDLGLNLWRTKYTGQINTPLYNVGPYQAINQQYFNQYIIYNPTYFPTLSANNPYAFFSVNAPTVNKSIPSCAAVVGKKISTQALYDTMLACIEAGGDYGLAGPPLPSQLIGALESGQRLNSGITIGKGLDLTANYAWDDTFGIGGQWRAGLIGEYLLNWDVSPIPSAPLIDEDNHFGYPLQFKARAQFGYDTELAVGGLSTTLFLNYANSYKMDLNLLPAGVGPSYANIGAYTTVDFSLIYRTEKTFDNEFLNDLSATFSMQNVFDTLPPLVLNSGSAGGIKFDPSNGSPLGRVVMIQVGKHW